MYMWKFKNLKLYIWKWKQFLLYFVLVEVQRLCDDKNPHFSNILRNSYDVLTIHSINSIFIHSSPFSFGHILYCIKISNFCFTSNICFSIWQSYIVFSKIHVPRVNPLMKIHDLWRERRTMGDYHFSSTIKWCLSISV